MGQEDNVEEELEALEDRNSNLREQLSEMETEFKYLKKLMMEAGLGSYAAAVKKKEPSLGDILSSCGIDYDLVGSPEPSPVQSPSSIHSDMELEKNQELIDELEDFFMKTDGKPTVVDEEIIDTNITMEELNNAMTTNVMTEDGQNVVIIIAPSSPAESLVSVNQ